MTGLLSPNWPSPSEFSEAIQTPQICFDGTELRGARPAVDRLGLPFLAAGQFAYVFKLIRPDAPPVAVRCFGRYLGDRDRRYRALSAHLESFQMPDLARFSYEPEGILVRGARYPVLLMEWVEGATLDVYIEEVLHRRDVMIHLAREWVALMNRLRAARIAHGDLQHGNVIVRDGDLRLVDFDGMFVPSMDGLTACELGHEHYQHPSRGPQHFAENIDNFSSLVIYLSLISLAERPSLWDEYHDEGLLFTRADFLDPAASALFSEIRKISPEHERLAALVESSIAAGPLSAPHIGDLVVPLPASRFGARKPAGVSIISRTRETGVAPAMWGSSIEHAPSPPALSVARVPSRSLRPALALASFIMLLYLLCSPMVSLLCYAIGIPSALKPGLVCGVYLGTCYLAGIYVMIQDKITKARPPQLNRASGRAQIAPPRGSVEGQRKTELNAGRPDLNAACA
jgi:hypothetical protein